MRILILLRTSLLLFIVSVGTAGTIIDEVVYWPPLIMADGSIRTDVVINPSSVRFVGGCDSTDEATTLQLFDQIAIAAIQRGLAEGKITCSSNCTGSIAIVRIYTAACVQRTGSSCSTKFIACDPAAQAWRDYRVCRSGSGGVTITLVGFSSSGCAGSSCESTVPMGAAGNEVLH